MDLINDAMVYGSEGRLKLPSPFWCPVKLETAEVSFNPSVFICCEGNSLTAKNDNMHLYKLKIV